jgi:hypothetical protein
MNRRVLLKYTANLIFAALGLVACTPTVFEMNETVKGEGWQVIVFTANKEASLRAPGLLAGYEPREGYVFLVVEMEVSRPDEKQMTIASQSIVVQDNQRQVYLPAGLGPPLDTPEHATWMPYFIFAESETSVPVPAHTQYRDGRTESISVQQDSWEVSVGSPVTPVKYRGTCVYVVPSNANGFMLKFQNLPSIDLGQ